MRHLILITLILSSVTAFAGKKTCKAMAIEDLRSSEGAVFMSVRDLKTNDYDYLDKDIYRNPSRKKVMKKLYKLAKKLPKCL
jgi:hypothetical protein